MQFEGFDVSHHQDSSRIQWELARAQGASFAYFRATYGTREDGWKWPRSPTRNVRSHVHASRKVFGARWGLYHFFRPTESEDAQFRSFLEVANDLGYGPGNLIPALDIEDDGEVLVSPAWVPSLRRLANLLRETFGGCLIYVNASDSAALGSDAQEWIRQFPGWVASHYDHGADLWQGRRPLTTIWPETWSVWQWTKREHAWNSGDALDRNVARELRTIPSIDRANARQLARWESMTQVVGVAATKQWQAARGLVPDGIVGPKTWSRAAEIFGR